MSSVFRFLLIFTAINLFIPTASAQYEDIQYGTLEAFLGRLPDVCYYDIATPECLSCIAYSKFIPLAILALIFFMVIFLLIEHINIREQNQQLAMRINALLAILLSLLFLHSTNPGKNVEMLIVWGGFLLIMMIIIFSGRFTGSPLGTLIVLIFILFFFVAVFLPNISSIMAYYGEVCAV